VGRSIGFRKRGSQRWRPKVEVNRTKERGKREEGRGPGQRETLARRAEGRKKTDHLLNSELVTKKRKRLGKRRRGSGKTSQRGKHQPKMGKEMKERSKDRLEKRMRAWNGEAYRQGFVLMAIFNVHDRDRKRRRMVLNLRGKEGEGGGEEGHGISNSKKWSSASTKRMKQSLL